MNFSSYMQRLKKMNHERLAESMGTRLDLTSSTTAIRDSRRLPGAPISERNTNGKPRPRVGGAQGSGPRSQAQARQRQEGGGMGEREEEVEEESDLGSDI